MSAGRAPASADVRFVDDFAGDELDRTRWRVSPTVHVVNDEEQAYVDSPDTVYLVPDPTAAGGAQLALHARHRPGFATDDGRRFDFVSGRLDTRTTFRFRYGSVAARLRLPVGPGLWPAFWALGFGSWPGTGEIDVMENVGDPGWVSAAVHGPGYSGEGGLVNHFHFAPGVGADDWHVYRAVWSDDEIAFEVDGRLVHRVTRPMTDFFGGWAFDDDKFLVLNLAVGGTYPYKTNGVRSPYYGVPSETVAAIADGNARLLVDWVEVVAI